MVGKIPIHQGLIQTLGRKKRVEKCQFSGKSWKNVRAIMSEVKSYWFRDQTKVRLILFDQSSNCSMAAALKVSAAPKITDFLLSL